MHRRNRTAFRNAGLSGRLSLRALIIRLPAAMSFAHDGTRPHRSRSSPRTFPALRTTAADCVGAILYRGTRPDKSGRPNISARSSAGKCNVNLPHMRLTASFYRNQTARFSRSMVGVVLGESGSVSGQQKYLNLIFSSNCWTNKIIMGFINENP